MNAWIEIECIGGSEARLSNIGCSSLQAVTQLFTKINATCRGAFDALADCDCEWGGEDNKKLDIFDRNWSPIEIDRKQKL